MASTFISLVEHHVVTFAFVGMEALVSYIQFKLKQPTLLHSNNLLAIFKQQERFIIMIHIDTPSWSL